jgi:hypothetical protein
MTKEEIKQIKSVLPKGWIDTCYDAYIQQATRRTTKSALRFAIDNIIQKSPMYVFWLTWATNYINDLNEKEQKLLNLCKK